MQLAVSVLPEKLTVSQLVKKHAAIRGFRLFVTVFTTARHLIQILTYVPENECRTCSSIVLCTTLFNIVLPAVPISYALFLSSPHILLSSQFAITKHCHSTRMHSLRVLYEGKNGHFM